MNKFTLKFDDEILEEQYQQVKLRKIRKPIYLGLLVLCFCMISSNAIINLITQQQTLLKTYINYSYLIFMVFQAIIVYRKPALIKYLLIISNIATGLLQFNFNDQTPAQIYYAQSSSFTQLQAVAYFISDFQDGVIQVLALLFIRLVITSIKIDDVDLQTVLIGLASTLFILITLYVNDQNSRKEFLSSISEDLWDHSLSILIKKPHFRVQYNKEYMKIDLISSHQLFDFPGYDENICQGCNSRQILHSYKYKKSNLSDFVLEQQQTIQNSIKVEYKHHSFYLRIVCVGIKNQNIIVIFEKRKEDTYGQIVPKKMRNLIFQQIKSQQKRSIYQILFNQGLLSILLINQMQLKEIDITQMFKKLNKQYKYSMKPIKILPKSIKLTLQTYSSQLKIFLIQIFQIFDQISKKRISILFQDLEDCILVQIIFKQNIEGNMNLLFLSLYSNNIFIQKIKQLLLFNELNIDLQMQFKKHIPYQLIQ
ncbi:unnamed protein product [Paramecium pentaurelia]|uniref:Transmembrane protein n=1 Tax=Paramecium pentaurelia TaxID=43138 RepID=A0A8S1Y0E4_9CILI|nr:unnamed protein product [Paramecium pentaurelia]